MPYPEPPPTPPSQPRGGPAGAAPDQSLQIILGHRHDATPLGGAQLRGPYFIVDEGTGKLQRIKLSGGVFSAVNP